MQPVSSARHVYRIVKHNPATAEDFLSDREEGKEPRGRQIHNPELLDGMSAFDTEGAARDRWARMKEIADVRGEPVKRGNFIAEVCLEPGEDFFIDDPGAPSQHLTIRGDRFKLADAVQQTFPAGGD